MSSPETRLHKAVTYLRAASPSDDPAHIASQREACQRLAALHGLQIIREYAELAQPAHAVHQPELQHMLHDLNDRRDAAFVIVWNYTRLSDNFRELEAIQRYIQACDAKVIALTGVAATGRFTRTEQLPESESSTPPPVTHPYPLSLLRTAWQGLAPGQHLLVTARLPTGETVRGIVTGIGSRLGIRNHDGRLIEDVQPEWVTNCNLTTARPQPR